MPKNNREKVSLVIGLLLLVSAALCFIIRPSHPFEDLSVDDIDRATANYYRDEYTYANDELESLVEKLRDIKIYREVKNRELSAGVNSSLTVYMGDGEKYHIICNGHFISINATDYRAEPESVRELAAMIGLGVEKLYEDGQ